MNGNIKYSAIVKKYEFVYKIALNSKYILEVNLNLKLNHLKNKKTKENNLLNFKIKIYCYFKHNHFYKLKWIERKNLHCGNQSKGYPYMKIISSPNFKSS